MKRQWTHIIVPPSPASHPTAHGCDGKRLLHNHPQKGVISHLCSQVLVFGLAGLAGILRGGHLQIVALLQQGVLTLAPGSEDLI